MTLQRHSPAFFVGAHRDRIRIKLLSPTAKAPQYMTAGAAGADVFADLSRVTDGDRWFGDAWGGDCATKDGGIWCVTLREGTARIPLGFAIEIPTGWVGILKGRSGEASRGNDAHVAYIDSDYRGECSMLIHVGRSGAVIKTGDRVGQIAIVPAPQFQFELAEELSDTARGTGGFGSTGSR